MGAKLKVGLFGNQGYVGKELIALIGKHPYLQLAGAYGSKTEHDVQGLDAVLLATPPEVSMDLTAKFQRPNLSIIDLSGAFRLSPSDFKQWYGIAHTAPELLSSAQYGLSPWNKQHTKPGLLANPGCYATGALLSLIPLMKHNIVKPNNLIIDAKSGVSGAGKKINTDLMFCEINENFFPYKVGQHQHFPEIKKALTHFTGKSCEMRFVTQLLPISRGIAMTIYADAETGFTTDAEITAAIHAAYDSVYASYPLATVGAIHAGDPEQDKFLLSLKSVVFTPKIHIAYWVKEGKITVFASIDNLLKGAASQALENLNAIYGFPLATGLEGSL